MDVQRIGEQRRDLAGLAEYLISCLFLIVGVATRDNRGPREVIAVGKQIFEKIDYHLHQCKTRFLTWIRPGRLDIGVIVIWKGVRAIEVQIQYRRSLLQGAIHCLDSHSELHGDRDDNQTVRRFERHDAISFAARCTSSAGT